MLATAAKANILITLAILLPLALCTPALAQEDSPETAQKTFEGISYSVEFEGAPSRSIRRLLEGASVAQQDQDRPPASLALLDRRAKNDLPALAKVMDAYGYFKAQITYDLKNEGLEPGDSVPVVFAVEPGPRFTLGELKISAPDSTPAELPTPEDVGLREGDDYAASDILQARSAITARLQNKGHPFAKTGMPKVIADFSTETVDVAYTVEPGPSATFGPLTVVTKGEVTVSVSYLRQQVDIESGEPFNRKQLREARQKILGTGLYAQAEFTPPEGLNAKGQYPLTLAVTEREHRSFRVGANVSTDRGLGGVLGWQHRNLFGGAQRLDIRLQADFVSRSLTFDYLEPRFLSKKQKLRLTARAQELELEGFDDKSLRLAGLLELDLGDGDTLGYGGAYTFIEVDDDPLLEDSETYHLVSAPFFYDRDRRNSALNPTRGYFLRVDAEPFFGVLGEQTRFGRYTVGSGTYLRLLEGDKLVLALRAKFGQILGADLDDIPASERFYAGGGGSVRGYDFKTLSPLVDDDPTGGRSLVESSAELRWRLPSDFGVVAFVDAGRAFDQPIPDFNEPIAIGVGVGARYYLSFGPVRLDIAVPLNRRDDIDPPVQVYASIGQAF